MRKLNDKQKLEIITKYKLDNSNNNIKAICNDYNISKQTIYNLLKSDIASDINESIIESKSNLTKRIDVIITQILDRIENEIQTSDKITLSQLSTTLGILYDKSRLEKNLSTNNSSININIKVEK